MNYDTGDYTNLRKSTERKKISTPDYNTFDEA